MESGLGNKNNTFVCVNPGGQCPNATIKKTVTTEMTAAATFPPENGQVTASLMRFPLYEDRDLGSHQQCLGERDAHYDCGDAVHVCLSVSPVVPKEGGREQFPSLLRPSGVLGVVGVTCGGHWARCDRLAFASRDTESPERSCGTPRRPCARWWRLAGPWRS
jgi:hypothetical protein